MSSARRHAEPLESDQSGRIYGKFRICPPPPIHHMNSMNWKSIRLELGKTHDFPAGSVSRAYLIRLPLNESGMVDPLAMTQHPGRATVRRYWSSEPDQRGYLVATGHDWAIRCDGKPDRLLQLNGTPVRLGVQVSVAEPDGTVLPFNISSIR